MPLFDYQCAACGHEFETLQGINEQPLTDCPECAAPQLKKKVAAPAFTFKGGGWYKDLYSSSSGGAKSGDTASSSSSSSSSASTSSSSDSSGSSSSDSGGSAKAS